MNIGFDAKRAFYNYSGLGNYSRNVILSLHKQFTDDQYHLYTPSLKNSINFISGENVHINTPYKSSGKIFKSYWRTFLLTGQLKKDKIDIFHGLSNELPYNIKEYGIKSVVTIHDLIFIRYPELYKPIDREIYNKKFKYSSEISDVIISVSEQTKRDLMEFYNIEKNKIKVIYQGCNERFIKKVPLKEINDVKEKYSLPSQYILYVGTIEERKNLLNVVKALHLGNVGLPLVIVGKTTPYLKQVVNYICQNQVENTIFLQAIPLADLPALYQGASLFIYPSVFEGFGIPILEALNSEIPVITSKGGCFKEVGGDAAYYIDPMNVDEIIDAIVTVLSDSDLATKMIKEGKSQSMKFSNEIIAKQMMQTYQELVQE